jgi:hypothetical protein
MAETKQVAEFAIDASGALVALDETGKKLYVVGENAKNVKGEIRALQEAMASGKLTGDAFAQAASRAGELKDQVKDASEAVNANAGPAFESFGNNASNLQDRLMSLDFEGVGQSAKGMATTIKNFSFKSITDGIKGAVTGFKALTTAMMSNPIILILTAIVAAVAAVAAAFSFMQDSAREDADNANKAILKGAEDRHRREKKLIAEAGNDEKKKYELKRQAARNDMADTQRQIAELENVEKRGFTLSEQQEKDLDALRKQYADQRVDYEVMAIDRINALNASRVDIERQYNQIGMSDRERQLDDLKNQMNDRLEQLRGQGADEVMIAKQTAVFVNKENELKSSWNKQDAAEHKANSDARKAKNKEVADASKAYEEDYRKEVEKIREELAANGMTEKQKEQAALDKYYGDLAIKYEKDAKKKEEFAELQKLAQAALDDKYKKIDEAKDIEKKAEELKREQEHADAVAEVRRNYDLNNMSDKDRSRAEEVDALVKYYDEQQQIVIDNDEQYIALGKQRDDKLKELQKKWNKEDLDAEEEKKQKKLAMEKELSQNRVELVKSGLSALSDLNATFEGQTEAQRKASFNRNKALGIADALISTYQSATKAYASQLVVGDVTSPVRASIAAGIAVAAGLAQVAKIAKTQYTGKPSGGGGGGGGGVGGGMPSAGAPNAGVPQFNPINTDFLTNRPNQVQPSYVLAGDVANASEARSRVRDLARL